MASFNSILDLIARSARYNIENSDEFRTLRQTFEHQRQLAGQEKDRNKRNQQLQHVKSAEKKLKQMLDDATGEMATRLDEWLVEGIQLWVDSFNPDQFHIRVYPFEDLPQFQVLANLKRDCFVDPDVQHLLFSYGTRPNVKLTILGLISSMPQELGVPFDPMAEFEQSDSASPVSDRVGFEQAFRQAFMGLEQLEVFGRFDRYPNVTVLPLAVFRSIKA